MLAPAAAAAAAAAVTAAAAAAVAISALMASVGERMGASTTGASVGLICVSFMSASGSQPASLSWRLMFLRIVEFHRRERLSDDEVALEAGLDTFFVSLTFEDYELAETRNVLRELSEDARVTALEFRCDLLRSYNPGNVLKQLHAAREASQASWRGGEAKLMFTVRSVSQAGAFRDEDVDEMGQLLELGLRAGVDWLDVETETLYDRGV